MFARNRSSHAPKGSFHNYCRQKLEAYEQLSRTKGLSTTCRPLRTAQTQRAAVSNAEEPSFTFEQYMDRFNEGPAERGQAAKSYVKRKASEKTNRHRRQERAEVKTEVEQTKGKTEVEQMKGKTEIIATNLPFFKCKLENVESISRRPDFRVKESKFKLNHNVVEGNQFSYNKSVYGC